MLKDPVEEMAIMIYVSGFSRSKGPSASRHKYPRWALGNEASKKYCQKTIHEIFQQNTHRLNHELSENSTWTRSSCFKQIYLVGRNESIIQLESKFYLRIITS